MDGVTFFGKTNWANCIHMAMTIIWSRNFGAEEQSSSVELKLQARDHKLKEVCGNLTLQWKHSAGVCFGHSGISSLQSGAVFRVVTKF